MEIEELVGFGVDQVDLFCVIDSDPAVAGVEALLKGVLRSLLEIFGSKGQFDAFLDIVLFNDASGAGFGGVKVLESRLQLVVAVGGNRSQSLLSGHFYFYISPTNQHI